MGLGKTLQSIALIVVGRDERRKREREEAELGAAGVARRGAAAVAAAEAAAAAASSGASRRPTLRLLSAPAPSTEDYDDGGAASAAADLRADLAATRAAKAAEEAAKASSAAAEAPPPRSAAALTLAACVDEVTRTSMAAREPFGPRPDGVCGGGGGGGCSHAHASTFAAASAADANSFSSATLVICPLVAVLQWKTEAERHVRPGVLHTIVHHGQRRATCPRELEKADIVLTTYSTLESDFRRASAATADRVRCGQCARWYTEEALVQHLAYFCQESNDAARTAKQALAVRKRPRGGGGGGGGGKGGKAKATASKASDPKGKGKAKKVASSSESEYESYWSSSDDDDDEDYGKTKRTKKAAAAKKKNNGDGPSSARRPLSAAALKAKERRLASLTFRDFDDDAFSDPEPPPGKESDGVFALQARFGGGGGGGGGASSASLGPDVAARGKRWPSRHHLRAARMAKLHRLIIARAGPPPSSVLHAVRWRRVILDEAHAIKDRTSSTACACFALDARARWCLSGTPLQNRVGELYSLLRFLRAYPFAYYFCKAGMVRPPPPPPRELQSVRSTREEKKRPTSKLIVFLKKKNFETETDRVDRGQARPAGKQVQVRVADRACARKDLRRRSHGRWWRRRRRLFCCCCGGGQGERGGGRRRALFYFPCRCCCRRCSEQGSRRRCGGGGRRGSESGGDGSPQGQGQGQRKSEKNRVPSSSSSLRPLRYGPLFLVEQARREPDQGVRVRRRRCRVDEAAARDDPGGVHAAEDQVSSVLLQASIF